MRFFNPNFIVALLRQGSKWVLVTSTEDRIPQTVMYTINHDRTPKTTSKMHLDWFVYKETITTVQVSTSKFTIVRVRVRYLQVLDWFVIYKQNAPWSYECEYGIYKQNNRCNFHPTVRSMSEEMADRKWYRCKFLNFKLIWSSKQRYNVRICYLRQDSQHQSGGRQSHCPGDGKSPPSLRKKKRRATGREEIYNTGNKTRQRQVESRPSRGTFQRLPTNCPKKN